MTETKLPLPAAAGVTMKGCCSRCSGLRPVHLPLSTLRRC